MATVMMHVFRTGKFLFRNVCPTKLSVDRNLLKHLNCRFLYSDQALGVDKFSETRDKISSQFVGLKEKFFSRMKEYVSDERQSMVFTEDVKNMIYMAGDKPEEIELCIQLMKKFHKQNKELKFGTFVFGPVAMRWVYFLDQPELVWTLLKTEELEGFFNQSTSFQIAMNLLYKHKMYQDILNIFDMTKELNFHGTRYPGNLILLTLGACYSLNTPESYKTSMSIIQEVREKGETILRRGLSFATKLALLQGHPEIAMEILSLTPSSSYVTIRNLRLQLLAELNRLEDVFPILRHVVDRDTPEKASPAICLETLELIQSKLDAAQDKEMLHIFEQVCRALKENECITSETIEQLLNRPLQGTNPNRSERTTSFQQGSTSRPGRSYTYRGNRPG